MHGDRSSLPRKSKSFIDERIVVSDLPKLLKFWDFGKNEMDPDVEDVHFNNTVFWICDKFLEHKWKESVYSRYQKMLVNRSICVFCGGKEVSSSLLADLHPKIICYWDTIKNDKINIYPDNFQLDSETIVNWKCDKNKHHRWKMNVSAMLELYRCPFCAGKIVSPDGTNSIKQLHPDLVSSYWFDKSDPNAFLPNSHTIVQWKCDLNHVFPLKILFMVKKFAIHNNFNKICDICSHTE